MLLSLAQIFGAGAFQDENILIINKASLLRLSPSIFNSPESLLTAILITALENFSGILNDENNQAITNEFNEPITFDNSDAFEFIKMIDWMPFLEKKASQLYQINQIIVFSYAPD
ncbi:hypothetical protein FM036_45620 [Nostoc sp. HG1]|nr:hypothetical protein [Nostoc sp. HG1]